MNLQLSDLASLEVELPSNAEDLEAAIRARQLSAEFLEGWEALMSLYGHRGPREIDLRSPRYREDPGLLLEQLIHQRSLPPEQRARALHQRCQQERQDAYQTLKAAMRPKGWAATRRFESFCRVVEALGGLRESHKFYVVQALDRIRTRALREVEPLVRSGRLSADQIFDLTLDDLQEALRDPTLDVHSLRKERTAFRDQLAQLPHLPRIIDSRGLILRAPRPPAREGELQGQPISAGVVRGRVKTLRSPREKPLEPGEILVARATDPGWTPLFAHAGAVVLEVGGLMQHGALVAREYGKPCVAGIPDLFEQLHDGMWVEVDGAEGVVRLLDERSE